MRYQDLHKIFIKFSLLTAALMILAQLAGGYSSKEYLQYVPDSGWGGDDHNRITQGAYGSIGLDYPDLERFQPQILAAASTEGIGGPGSHKSVDGSITYWSGNEGNWEADAQLQYGKLNFGQAYTELGYAVHLLEDITVPAHLKVDFHGLPLKYTLSPTNGFIVGPTSLTAIHSDAFEQHSSNFQSLFQPTGVNISNQYSDSLTGCPEEFWMNSQEDGGPINGNGVYGQNPSSTSGSCKLPIRGFDVDWFSQSDTTIQDEYSAGEMFAAQQNALTELQNFSKTQRPIVSYASVSGSPLNGDNSLTISYNAVENRTPTGYLSVKILDANQNDTGMLIKSSETFTFSDEPNTNLLPYTISSNFSWNGKINGQLLGYGTYYAQIIVTDNDNNDSVIGPNTIAPFTVLVDTTPPTLQYYDQDGGPFQPNTDAVSILATDTGSGPASITVTDPSGSNITPTANAVTPTTLYSTFQTSDDGTYQVQSCDKAGNCATGSFIINTNPCQDPTSQTCKNQCDQDPNGPDCQEACRVDPESQACQDACKLSPDGNSCQTACDQDANSAACQDACKESPDGNVCQGACHDDPDSDACIQSCQTDPTGNVCTQTCRDHPTAAACQDPCRIDVTSPACQQECNSNNPPPECPDPCDGPNPPSFCQPTCQPNCGCAANLCPTSSCADGCGGYCRGNKKCTKGKE